MNKEVIAQLEKEKQERFPYGFVIPARGSSKTTTVLYNNMMLAAYNNTIRACESIDHEITIEEAHKMLEDNIEKVLTLN